MVVEVPDWARAHIRGTKKLTFVGACCAYCEVSPELGIENGFPEIFTIHSEGFFAVSEAYPAKWRELGVAHEFIEHALLVGIDEKDRCLTALKIELGIAKKSGFDMPRYIEFRCNFFNDLIRAYRDKGAKSPSEEGFIERLERSRDYLLTPLLSAVLGE